MYGIAHVQFQTCDPVSFSRFALPPNVRDDLYYLVGRFPFLVIALVIFFWLPWGAVPTMFLFPLCQLAGHRSLVLFSGSLKRGFLFSFLPPFLCWSLSLILFCICLLWPWTAGILCFARQQLFPPQRFMVACAPILVPPSFLLNRFLLFLLRGRFLRPPTRTLRFFTVLMAMLLALLAATKTDESYRS